MLTLFCHTKDEYEIVETSGIFQKKNIFLKYKTMPTTTYMRIKENTLVAKDGLAGADGTTVTIGGTNLFQVKNSTDTIINASASTITFGSDYTAPQNCTLQVSDIQATSILITEISSQAANALNISGANGAQFQVDARGIASYLPGSASDITGYGPGLEDSNELARQGDMFAEASRAKSAEDSLTSRVSVEESRAASAEDSLTSRVSVEESRAASAEDSLTSRVSV
ncbi:MAG: hypothetical protein EBT07_17010, partial [Actinobacteria bacterium]|nr:hypothetical protein [Actinomycetota bacterium]